MIPDWLKALLSSRKFWMALLGVISAVVLYLQGAIGADALVDAIVALVAILIGGIALEDAAAKRAAGDVTLLPSAEVEAVEVEIDTTYG